MKRDALRIGLLLAAATLFAGCSLLPTAVEPVVEPVVEEPVEEPVEAPAPVVSKPPPPKVEEPAPVVEPLPPVAIVLTSRQAAYADVARELTRHFDNYELYDLSDASRPPVTVLRLVNDANPGVVIAIGLRAALSSIAMSKQPVVFSQVFNYRHHGLLSDTSRGVAVLPPFDAQLAAWKEIDPTIGRIGLIVGEGHDDLVEEAELAAERHGIELVVQVTRSDQETLFFFRRMIRDIDGFWLLPDNRVLSSRVLQQMFADAKRQRVPVTVPSDSMLSLGAMISMTTHAADIAQTIVKVVRAIQSGNLAQVPPVTPLSEIRVTTNSAAQAANR